MTEPVMVHISVESKMPVPDWFNELIDREAENFKERLVEIFTEVGCEVVAGTTEHYEQYQS